MDRKAKLRIYAKWIRHGVKERAVDLAMISWPVFLMVGLVMGSVKIWGLILWGF